MGKWATILNIGKGIAKYGKYAVNNPVTRGLGGAVVHPQRTLMGAGRTLKTATIGAGMGYVGWQALVNDKPVVRTVADVAFGSETVDAAVETTTEAVKSMQEAARDVRDSVSGLNGTVQQAGGLFNGISDFLRNITGGNGTGMFGNFFSNIASGNVSGLSIVGLLVAGMMIFGRFGWLGKIGGALLAMMLIGNNSHIARQQAPQQEQQNDQQQPSAGRHR